MNTYLHIYKYIYIYTYIARGADGVCHAACNAGLEYPQHVTGKLWWILGICTGKTLRRHPGFSSGVWGFRVWVSGIRVWS